MDFKLDPLTWDLDMSTGEVEAVSGGAAICQHVRIRYQFFLGEWFLDTRLGVPWFQEIFRKNASRARVDFLLRRVLTTTPGVASVISFSVGPLQADRTVSLTWSARLTSGAVLRSSDFGPFILDFSTLLG